jgi:hypothetical protein
VSVVDHDAAFVGVIEGEAQARLLTFGAATKWRPTSKAVAGRKLDFGDISPGVGQQPATISTHLGRDLENPYPMKRQLHRVAASTVIIWLTHKGRLANNKTVGRSLYAHQERNDTASYHSWTRRAALRPLAGPCRAPLDSLRSPVR